MKSSPNFKIEKSFLDKGYKYIAGCDEAGRGALAGPIFAACVIFDPVFILENLQNSQSPVAKVNDSKQLSSKTREELFDVIRKYALNYKIVHEDADLIDKRGIQYANTKVLYSSTEDLEIDIVISDFFFKHEDFEFQKPLNIYKGGDGLSLSIAAASILAKVSRDRFMKREAQKKYPLYGFDKHYGYGTLFHREKIKEFGCCPIHRNTFIHK